MWVAPKRYATRQEESPATTSLAFDRFREIAAELDAFYRHQDATSIWTTGYEFVASEIRSRSFDSRIGLLFQGVSGNESEIQLPFRTVAAIDALPTSERLGDTIDELTLLIMEELVGCSEEELGATHVIEFDAD